MPTQPNAESPPSEDTKEQRLAKRLTGLDQRELAAYRYFVKTKQPEPGEVIAEELFKLYLQGADCEEIRRQKMSLSLGQVVACKVMFDWDARRAAYRTHLQVSVPERAAQVHLEQVDFMADMLTAAQAKTRDRIRQYLITKDEKLLEDIPIPKNMREYQALFDMFLRGTGQDKKKIEVSGSVSVDHRTGLATSVSADEAANIIDNLLADEAIDVKAVPVHRPQAALPAPAPASPKTPEEMIALLVSTGVPEEKARAMVKAIEGEAKDLANRYHAIWEELLAQKKGPVN